MKKLFALLLTILMMVSMSVAVLAGPPVSTRTMDTFEISDDEAEFKIADLMAGQDHDVGDLFIDPLAEDDTYLVTYKITEPDWFLSEVHFEAISAGDDVFIYSNGGLIPGKFTVKKSWDLADEVLVFSFVYKAGDTVTDFSAHAVVGQHAIYEDKSHTLEIVSDTNTLFSTNGVDNWLPSIIAWDHPSWPQIAGAEWIWESYQVDAPRTGDTIYFKRDFSIVGVPTSAVLKITADNEFYATINGMPDPEFFNNSWAVVSDYDVLAHVKNGMNTLNITGTNWAWNTDSPTSNPGAIVYKLVVNSLETVLVTPSVYESVWGEGIPVNQETGGNWSMIIPIPEVDCLLVETLEVPSTNMTGIDSSVLKDGYHYCIEASGTYKFASWSPGDAGMADAKFNCRSGSYIPALTGKTAEEDYHINSDGTVWINGQAFGYLLGLQVRIDGEYAMWNGVYNEAHIYDKSLVGSGSAVNFAIYDNVYSDNSGFITVKISKNSFVAAP